MEGSANRKNIIAILILSTALLLSASLSHAQRFSAWSAAQNSGPTINTTALEGCPFIAPDNLSLFFASDRAGGAGGVDIWSANRANANAPWGTPVNLGTNINTTGTEFCPTLMAGGLTLYFVSDRPGGCGGNDIYVSQRMTTNSQWGAAINLGCQLNSPQSDITPSVFTDANGTTFLYFSSNRPGGPGMQDIYVSTLQPGGPFGAPALVAELNTAFNDLRPNIRVRDGLEIFFESNRTGTLGLTDLYVAARGGTSAPWSTPVNLGATVNSASGESRASLSFDGRELYFQSNRPGGAGGEDIYVAGRNIFTPYDTDGDARTDIRAYRQSTGIFWVLNSAGNGFSTYSLGGTGQGTFIPGLNDDYDGDGKSDLVVFTAPTGGVRTWRVLQSGSNSVREVQWGLSSDQTVPGDYDGDGRIDIAVYRRSEGIWYILFSTTNQMRAEFWGLGPNDFAMVGDYDRDGINDLTVVRPGTSGSASWFTRRSSDGAMVVDNWGGGVPNAVDSLFPAIHLDIDGDAIQDRMVVRDPDSTANGTQTTYFIQRSSDRSMFAATWGLDTDGRAFGDFDGDGKTDLAARRVISGQLTWFILLSYNNFDPAQARLVQWGVTGDVFAAEDAEESGAMTIN